MIVRNIVMAHHGTIDYTSEAGKGTIFQLSLPLRTGSQATKIGASLRSQTFHSH
jgi:signal transduction histidine kinase